jgi:hypothetical protein
MSTLKCGLNEIYVKGLESCRPLVLYPQCIICKNSLNFLIFVNLSMLKMDFDYIKFTYFFFQDLARHFIKCVEAA